MFGHDDDKKTARRPLPDGFLKRTQPPRRPRDDKSAEQIAHANAEAFGQNAHIQAHALPVRPAGGPSITHASGPTLARPDSHGSARSQQGKERERTPPAFGLLSSSRLPAEERQWKKAPYPVSVYGEGPESELHSVSYGQPAYEQEQLPPPQGSALGETNPRDSFAPGLVHPRAAVQLGMYPPKPARSSSPQPHQFYPITPPHRDKYGRPSSSTTTQSAAAAHSHSAYPNNGNTPVTHTSLAPSEIRLIRIAHSSSGPLRLTFVHTFLNRPIPYIALSYTWGSTQNKAIAELDGHPIPITNNLNQALLKLRDRDRDVICWADAICINQSDKSEVSDQVLLMRSIYSLANSVAVWLGSASSDSDEAIKFLDTIATHGKHRNDGTILRIIESPQHRKDFAAVVSLFQREYWRRVWVVQEVLNGGLITVHCGPSSLSWDTLQQATEAFRRNSKHIERHYSSLIGDNREPIFLSSQNRLSYARALQELGPSSFKDMRTLLGSGTATDTAFKATKFLVTLQTCRDKFATDPRDKVYGVLGVSPQDAQTAITPDYKMPIGEVYTKAAEYVITASRRLDIVCHALHYPVHVTALGLPTWVPDWSHISPMTAIDWPMGRFRAGADMQEETSIADHGTLNVQAIFIDKIRSRGIPVGTTNTVHDMVMSFLHWFSLLQERFKSKDNAELEIMEMEFCRLLVFDNMHPLYAGYGAWRHVTLHLFASLAADLLPEMPLHHRLIPYSQPGVVDLYGVDRNTLLEESFSTSMTGRSFFMTNSGHIGMGSGYLAVGDHLIVPFGCPTPLILRTDGDMGEYRLVSDAFVGGYMYGQAVNEWKSGTVRASRYRIH
ncbi:HET domain-containing protein [Ophiostoma piceae UAMH 11346]|uniref:HET domain-containing protein n=1 Tax=Ophiostoma piceae (strain UAMH 11346) TaxID=1262450 RepID=S3BRE0_OPHP1|nr:HET domain-containing protein [Ophiostoma piceae UAMH 11346]